MVTELLGKLPSGLSASKGNLKKLRTSFYTDRKDMLQNDCSAYKRGGEGGPTWYPWPKIVGSLDGPSKYAAARLLSRPRSAGGSPQVPKEG
jgi:hypothetical protein